MNNLARILRGAQFIEHPVARSGETIFMHPITAQFIAVQSLKTEDHAVLEKTGWQRTNASVSGILGLLQKMWPDLETLHPEILGPKLNEISSIALLTVQTDADRLRVFQWLNRRAKSMGRSDVVKSLSKWSKESQHSHSPLAPSFDFSTRYLVSKNSGFAYVLSGSESDGYELQSYSLKGLGTSTRAASGIRELLWPEADWSDFEWEQYIEILTAEPVSKAHFLNVLPDPGPVPDAGAIPVITKTEWLDRVHKNGIKALLGGAHSGVRKTYLNEPTTPWLEDMATLHGIEIDSISGLHQLVDAWATLRIPDTAVRELILPLIRANTGASFQSWADTELLSLWRECFPMVIKHAALLPSAPSRPLTFKRHAPLKTNMTSDVVRSVLREHYGENVIRALESASKLEIFEDARFLPEAIRARYSSEQLGLITGFTASGRVGLIANMLTPETAAGVFLHEVGEHAGLAQMLGPDYSRVIMQFDKLLKAQDTYATWAAMRVPKNTPKHQVSSERIAYLVERVANDSNARRGGSAGHELGRECLANLRTWLFRTPTFQWLEQAGEVDSFTLSPMDLAALARESVNFHANIVQPGSADDLNRWGKELDQTQLDTLFASDPLLRQSALDEFTADKALGYLYSLTVLKAPGVQQNIEAFRLTLVAIIAGEHSDHLRDVAGEILAEADVLENRRKLEAQLGRTGLAAWIDNTSSPADADLYRLTESTQETGIWVLEHSKANVGLIGKTEFSNPSDALGHMQNSAFQVPDEQLSDIARDWASLSQPTDGKTDSPQFLHWFGNSMVTDVSGNPLVLYHGTARDFLEFNADFHRSSLNEHYQGDGFHFSESPLIASKYADSSRNNQIDQASAIQAVADVFPPRISKLFTDVVNEGYEAGWAMPAEDLRALFAEIESVGLDINDLLDIAPYVAGSRYNHDDKNHNELFNLFSGLGEQLPEYVRDLAVRLGLERVLPNQNVIAAFLRADNVLFTADPNEARQAKENGFDGVHYSGPGTVDGAPEWIVFRPEQIKNAMGSIGPNGKAKDSIFFRRDNTVQSSFTNWFAGSKVVTEDGSPKIVYHGSTVWERDGRQLGDVESFDRLASVNIVRRQESIDTVGIWFSDKAGEVGAEMYSGAGGVIYPVYLDIKNPWVPASFDELLNRMHLAEGRDPSVQTPKGLGSTEGLREWLRTNGFDGIKLGPFLQGGEFSDQTAWIALEPGQVKSAIGNRGTFDPTLSDIRLEMADPVSEAFAKWFDGSAIVDRQGLPLVVYHGTSSDFSVFSKGPAYFSPRWDYSYVQNSEIVLPVFLSIKNPYRPDTKSEIEQIRNRPERLLELKALGYDGILWANPNDLLRGATGWGDDLPQIVAFDPEQIKSAIGNRGTFDSSNPDISLRSHLPVASAFQQWFGNSPVINVDGTPRVMYHGTPTPDGLNEFVIGGVPGTRESGDQYGVASYFTSDPIEAERYAGPSGAIIPVYISGAILDLSGDLSEPQKAQLTALANSQTKPPDKARFQSNRTERSFSSTEGARILYEEKLLEWQQIGQGFERAKPVVDKVGDQFVIRFTDFNRPLDITNGDEAVILFTYLGWDTVVSAGFDGVILPRDSGAQWVVMHRPQGNVKSVFNLGSFDRSQGDIRLSSVEALKPAKDSVTANQAFAAWFGESIARHPSGEPIVYFHGARTEFTSFSTPISWAASSPDLANQYAELGRGVQEASPQLLPVYIKSTSPFDADAAGPVTRITEFCNLAWRQAEKNGQSFAHSSASQLIGEIRASAHDLETGPYYRTEEFWHHPERMFGNRGAAAVKELLMVMGFDSISFTEQGHKTLGVFQPNQLKSAIGNSGTYSDNNDDIRFQLAYHGTPFEFDRFSLDGVGSGEGIQAFGWGLYFSSAKDVAEYYRETLSLERGFSYKHEIDLTKAEVLARIQVEYGDRKLDDRMSPSEVAEIFLDGLVYSGPGRTNEFRENSERREFVRFLERSVSRHLVHGNLYQVDLPENDAFLDWDTPLADQPDKITAAFRNYAGELGRYEGLTGGDAYKVLQMEMGAKSASLLLNTLGIRGCRYQEKVQTSSEMASRNFVVWDDAAIKITMINGNQIAGNDPLGETHLQRVHTQEMQIDSIQFSLKSTETSSSFTQWFNRSCAKDRNGEPLILFRSPASVSEEAVFQSGLGAASFMTLQSVLGEEQRKIVLPGGGDQDLRPAYLAINRPLLTTSIPNRGPSLSLRHVEIDSGSRSAHAMYASKGISLYRIDGVQVDASAIRMLPEELYADASMLMKQSPFVQALKASGFDGVISEEEQGDPVYYVFNAAQVLEARPLASKNLLSRSQLQEINNTQMEQLESLIKELCDVTPFAVLERGSCFSGAPQNTFTQEATWEIDSELAHGILAEDMASVARHFRRLNAGSPGVGAYKGIPLTSAQIRHLLASNETPNPLAEFLKKNQAEIERGGDIFKCLGAAINNTRSALAFAEDQLRKNVENTESKYPSFLYQHSLAEHRSTLGWLLNHLEDFSDPNPLAPEISLLNQHPHESEYLVWDAPIEAQSHKVRAALAKTGFDGHYEIQVSTAATTTLPTTEVYTSLGEARAQLAYLSQTGVSPVLIEKFEEGHPITKGRDVYLALSNILGGGQAASEHLKMLGVPGVAYSSQSGKGRHTIFVDPFESKLSSSVVLAQQPGTNAPQLRLPIYEVPGLGMPGELQESSAALRHAVSSAKARDKKRVIELGERLKWARGIAGISSRVLEGTKDGLTKAENNLSRLKHWVQPTPRNMLPWNSPIGAELASRVNRIVRLDGSAMNGQQVFYFIADQLGGNTAATKALSDAGIIGAYDSVHSTVWCETTEDLSKELMSCAGDIKFHLAYHGSAKMIDTFSLDHVGEGEGAQAYGYGLYFAQRKSVAGYYQNQQSRHGHWYENEFFRSPEDMANVIAPALADRYPELRGEVEGFNALESALRRVIHLVGFGSASKLTGVLESLPGSIRDVCSHVVNGISRVTTEQQSEFFILPAGGVRTLNNLTDDQLSGMQEITAALRWKLTPDMAEEEIQNALEKTLMVVCDQTHWLTNLARIEAKLMLKPDDPYLLSRKMDLEAFHRLAIKAQEFIAQYSPLEVHKPLGFGNVYLINLAITPGQYLRHDLSFKEQSPLVQSALVDLIGCTELDDHKRSALKLAIDTNETGDNLHGAIAGRSRSSYAIASTEESERNASKLLLSKGVQGIQYPDGEPLGITRSFNYVVFDDSKIEVLGHTSSEIKSEADVIPIYEWADIDALEQAQLNRSITMR